MSDQTWQTQLSDVITSPEELFDILELDKALLKNAQDAGKLFPLRVPRGFVRKMKPGDVHDPLLRQVIPLGDELAPVPGYHNDPLNEQTYSPHPGLLHKYPGRVLLVTTGACAIHCRYCFRRNFPYQEHNPGTHGLQQAFDYIKQNPSIHEIILSGGDPLSLSDRRLVWLFSELGQIPHLKRIRLHTRLPVVIPERMNEALLTLLTSAAPTCLLVLHINHPNELDAHLRERCHRYHSQGILLLNQSVLLKGVNDSVETLYDLSEKLVDARIIPYYLHLLDKVKGAAHYAVSEADGVHLLKELREQAPGFMVPKLVYEQPGQLSKSPITP